MPNDILGKYYIFKGSNLDRERNLGDKIDGNTGPSKSKL